MLFGRFLRATVLAMRQLSIPVTFWVFVADEGHGRRRETGFVYLSAKGSGLDEGIRLGAGRRDTRQSKDS